MTDLLRESPAEAEIQPRQRFILEDTGFNEVPKKYRRFWLCHFTPDPGQSAWSEPSGR